MWITDVEVTVEVEVDRIGKIIGTLKTAITEPDKGQNKLEQKYRSTNDGACQEDRCHVVISLKLIVLQSRGDSSEHRNYWEPSPSDHGAQSQSCQIS
jgi:hypothetical protein